MILHPELKEAIEIRVKVGWFAANPGARDGLTIATKVASRTEGERGVISNDTAWMEGMLDASLKRLSIDCVDLFYDDRPEPGRAIQAALPVGWAHGERYTAEQWVGPERYC